MFKKTKGGIEIDSQAADRESAPRFKGRPAPAAIARAGREMKADPPASLAKTKKKFGAKRARSQKVAILLSKARKGA